MVRDAEAAERSRRLIEEAAARKKRAEEEAALKRQRREQEAAARKARREQEATARSKEDNEIARKPARPLSRPQAVESLKETPPRPSPRRRAGKFDESTATREELVAQLHERDATIAAQAERLKEMERMLTSHARGGGRSAGKENERYERSQGESCDELTVEELNPLREQLDDCREMCQKIRYGTRVHV
jgi:hypothetical protein